MVNSFDYKNGILSLNVKKIKYKLGIRKPITIVDGDSGSGKTLLINSMLELQESEENNGSAVSYDNIIVINSKKSLSYLKKEVKENLFIIDKCSVLLTGEAIQKIKYDKENCYLLFGRGHFNLGLTPNYYAEMKYVKGVFTLNYAFSEEGWF